MLLLADLWLACAKLGGNGGDAVTTVDAQERPTFNDISFMKTTHYNNNNNNDIVDGAYLQKNISIKITVEKMAKP